VRHYLTVVVTAARNEGWSIDLVLQLGL